MDELCRSRRAEITAQRFSRHKTISNLNTSDQNQVAILSPQPSLVQGDFPVRIPERKVRLMTRIGGSTAHSLGTLYRQVNLQRGRFRAIYLPFVDINMRCSSRNKVQHSIFNLSLVFLGLNFCVEGLFPGHLLGAVLGLLGIEFGVVFPPHSFSPWFVGMFLENRVELTLTERQLFSKCLFQCIDKRHQVHSRHGAKIPIVHIGRIDEDHCVNGWILRDSTLTRD